MGDDLCTERLVGSEGGWGQWCREMDKDRIGEDFKCVQNIHVRGWLMEALFSGCVAIFISVSF